MGKTSVLVYTKEDCPYCIRAKNLLTQLNIPFEEIDLTDNASLREEISQKAGGWKTVPMIWIGEKFIGGYDDLKKLHTEGHF